MEDAVKTPNVVEATNKPGLFNQLENLKKRWVQTSPLWGSGYPCSGLPTLGEGAAIAEMRMLT